MWKGTETIKKVSRANMIYDFEEISDHESRIEKAR
jgi:hypothetical protein